MQRVQQRPRPLPHEILRRKSRKTQPQKAYGNLLVSQRLQPLHCQQRKWHDPGDNPVRRPSQYQFHQELCRRRAQDPDDHHDYDSSARGGRGVGIHGEFPWIKLVYINKKVSQKFTKNSLKKSFRHFFG